LNVDSNCRRFLVVQRVLLYFDYPLRPLSLNCVVVLGSE
jgi:hypothetical protein